MSGVKNRPLSEEEEIAILKQKAVEYYRELPVKKLAAAKVGRSYDTINDWENNDARFSMQLQEAKADWAVKHTKKSSPQFLLERVMRSEFGPTLDVTSAGKELSGLTIIKNGDQPQ